MANFSGNDPFYPQFRMDRYSTKIEGGASRTERLALELFSLIYAQMKVDAFGTIHMTGEGTRQMAMKCVEAANIFIEVIDSMKPTVVIPPPKEEPATNPV